MKTKAQLEAEGFNIGMMDQADAYKLGYDHARGELSHLIDFCHAATIPEAQPYEGGIAQLQTAARQMCLGVDMALNPEATLTHEELAASLRADRIKLAEVLTRMGVEL